jgi:glycine/serine hydroxymethyltransferase
MGEDEMRTIAALIGRTLTGRADESELDAVRADVAALCAKFPPYPDLLT